MTDAALAERPLTDRQRLVLSAIVAHWRATGGSPTLRELCRASGIKTPNGIVAHITALRRRGLIETDEKTARSIWPAGLRQAIREAAERLHPCPTLNPSSTSM